MKEGIFKKLPLLFLGLGFLQLSGCAALFELGEEDDPSAYDRGYQAYSEDECSGRFCDTEADSVTEHSSSPRSGRHLANQEDRRVRRAIESRDIVLGMTRQNVVESWGEPLQVEVAGRGSHGNERWIYGTRYSLGGFRTVIFENGRVAGWHR